MSTDATPRPPEPTAYQKFEALARRILTTPKAELVKDAPKRTKPPAKRRK